MKDEEIVELYWARSEQALAETEKSYGSYCRSIARGLLPQEEDWEECVNDTYLMILLRTRGELKETLEREGLWI